MARKNGVSEERREAVRKVLRKNPDMPMDEIQEKVSTRGMKPQLIGTLRRQVRAEQAEAAAPSRATGAEDKDAVTTLESNGQLTMAQQLAAMPHDELLAEHASLVSENDRLNDRLAEKDQVIERQRRAITALT